jgi:glycosyltransferase involved in cell wall biosynthesis
VKKKVLIIVENQPVPFDPRVSKEARSLHEAGYEVTVLSPRTEGYELGHEVIDGVHIYRHPMPEEGDSPLGYLREYSLALFWEFCYAWWIYLRHGFHVIQGCNPPDDIFLVALPFKLLGVKYIFDHHDANPELYLSKYGKRGLFYKAQVLLEKLTYRFSDVVLATNASYERLAVTRGRIAPEDVFIVRNGPDLETFCPVPSNPTRKYGKPYLVGYVGNMSIQEGLDILLDAALHIKNLGRSDIHFTCVGDGPGLAGLRKLTRDKGLEGMVNFTGRVPDEQLLEILSTADICVNPDKPCEMNDISTMNKIMEYMALGKPIVQFDLSEGRFSAQDAAVYADTRNQVADFAAKILGLVENPDERRRMGEFGRRRVERELAWQHSVQNLLAAYQRAFTKKRALKQRVLSEKRVLSKTVLPSGQDEIRANDALVQYYRCPESYVRVNLRGSLSERSGYFDFGTGTTCYGRCVGHAPSDSPAEVLPDVLASAMIDEGSVNLPFDLKEVVDNLRCELYSQGVASAAEARMMARAYYLVRPLLPVSLRKHLQRWRLRDWERLPFPHWPVDRTVDQVFEQAMLLSLKAQGVDQIPFVWFWPEGATSCAIMTHDVETAYGVRSCPYLMDMEDAFGIKGSFQIIPEQRYEVTDDFLDSIRQRGFEVVVHDLNHDGQLFRDKDQFLRRAKKINSYKEQFRASGFRAAVLYRKQLWFEALDFSYDMSVPNVAHLDPQRGGCCTVMPYFVGKILELPVTTTQDYTLFNILDDYSIDLWKKQINLIMEKHGLISVIVHPDYVRGSRERAVFEALLAHLADLRREKGIWIATPGEVDRWWRQRAEMKVVKSDLGWRVEGPGSERARVAYVSEENGRITYRCSSEPVSSSADIPVKGASRRDPVFR